MAANLLDSLFGIFFGGWGKGGVVPTNLTLMWFFSCGSNLGGKSQALDAESDLPAETRFANRNPTKPQK